MKKFLVVILSGLLLLGTFGLVACVNSNGNDEEEIGYYTEGLEYEVYGDGYSVVGIGTATDTEIVIPSKYNGASVLDIAERAFEYCKNITSVKIPNSVKSIRDEVFYGCNNLVDISVGNGIEYISDYWRFGNEPIEWVENEIVDRFHYTEYKGAKYIGNEKNPYLIMWSYNRSSTTFEIANGTRFIMCAIDAYVNIDYQGEINIPDTVKVSNMAISGSNRNVELNFNEYDNGLYLGNSKNPYYALVKPINNVISSIDINPNTKIINAEALSGCVNLTSIVIPDSVESIGMLAFYNCPLKEIVIGKGLKNIGQTAFTTELGITREIVFEYKGTVDQWAGVYIQENRKNANSSIYGMNQPLEYANKFIADGKEVTELNFTSAKIIQDFTFKGGNFFTKINIGNSVKNIGKSAFFAQQISNIDYLKEINFGNGVEVIGDNAFINCLVSEVRLPDSLRVVGDEAFYYGKMFKVFLPRNLESIGYDAFVGCDNLTEVINKSSFEITAGSTDFGSVAENAKQVITDESQSKVVIKNDFVFYSDNENSLLLRYVGNLTELILPSDINGYNYTISKSAFKMCNSIVSLNTGDGVKKIESYAFEVCQNLEYVVIGNGVTHIEKNAFIICESIISVKFMNTEGWSAGRLQLSSEDLSNETTAKDFLTSDQYYLYSEWIRSDSSNN